MVEDTEGTEHSQGTRSVFDLCVFDPALAGASIAGCPGPPAGGEGARTPRPIAAACGFLPGVTGKAGGIFLGRVFFSPAAA